MQSTPPDPGNRPALPGRFDAARMQQLVRLTGPALAPTLLAQLVVDIDACHRQLEAALAQGDWDGLRRASHDLISLAGSCGAETLHDLARQANAAAHARDSAALAADRARIAAEAVALTDLIRALQGGQTPW